MCKDTAAPAIGAINGLHHWVDHPDALDWATIRRLSATCTVGRLARVARAIGNGPRALARSDRNPGNCASNSIGLHLHLGSGEEVITSDVLTDVDRGRDRADAQVQR